MKEVTFPPSPSHTFLTSVDYTMISHLVLKHRPLAKIDNNTKGREQATPVKSLLPRVGMDKKLSLYFEATDRIKTMWINVGPYPEIIQHFGT